MIDLCVVNYNTKDLLARFLDSLHSDFSENIWNLYVCDNGSSDGSKQWLIENKSNYSINEIHFNNNIGYSSACNHLASRGSADIICLLNADVWMKTEDIKKIQSIFYGNDQIHILGPKQRDEDGFITHAGIVGTNTSPRHRGWREHDPGDKLYRDRIDCVTVSGSAYFIRRNVWLSMTYNPKYQNMVPGAIGAFLPTPHYYEETWCSYYARSLGYNVIYDGSVSIGHSWHKSSPVGGEADQKFKISQKIFREACDYMGIDRD
jgi:GT2 family glycosyltransferase